MSKTEALSMDQWSGSSGSSAESDKELSKISIDVEDNMVKKNGQTIMHNNLKRKEFDYEKVTGKKRESKDEDDDKKENYNSDDDVSDNSASIESKHQENQQQHKTSKNVKKIVTNHDSYDNKIVDDDMMKQKRILPRRSCSSLGKSFRDYHRLRNLFWSETGNDIPKRLCGRDIELTASRDNTKVYFIPKFLTEHEMRHLDLIVTQYEGEFEASRSYMDDATGQQIVSDHRTSTFIHLRKLGDAVTSAIERRAADISGLPVDNIEPLQIVSYRDGQHFGIHHDLGPLHEDGHVEVIKGIRRLVTFFVYLNDLPKGEGETAFPEIHDLKVQPVRGSAVFFCNVKADGNPDPLVVHQACPVRAPHRKFGMNIWICEESMMAHVQQRSGLLLDTQKLQMDKKTVLSNLSGQIEQKSLTVGDILPSKLFGAAKASKTKASKGKASKSVKRQKKNKN